MAPFILLCNWALSWEHLFIAALLQWLHYLPHSSPFWAGKENIGLPCHPSYYYLQIIPYFSMTPKTQRKHVAWLHDRAVGSHCRLLAPGWLQSSMLSQPLTLLLSIFWGISASKVDPRRLTSFHQPVCPCTDLVFHHLSCQSCNPYFTKNCCFPLLVSNCCLLPFSSFFPVPDSKTFDSTNASIIGTLPCSHRLSHSSLCHSLSFWLEFLVLHHLFSWSFSLWHTCLTNL